jgi:Rha family phage regulatory protein
MESSLVKVVDGRAMANSLEVAHTFEKEHKHVMRDIRKLIDSGLLGQSTFGLSSYINEQNKEQPAFNMTKDGFVMLAMGFTSD